MTFLRTLAMASLLVSTLSACGGGDLISAATGTTTGTGGSTTTPTYALPSFGTLGSGPYTAAELTTLGSSTALQNLVDAYDNGTLVQGTPTTASAQYNGLAAAVFSDDTAVVGRLSMTATFGSTNTVTGSAGDFAYYDTDINGNTQIDTYAGTLPISNGTISGTTMTANMNGTLSSNAGLGNYTVNTALSGVFADNGSQPAVIGSVVGNLVDPTGANQTINGFYLGSN